MFRGNDFGQNPNIAKFIFLFFSPACLHFTQKYSAFENTAQNRSNISSTDYAPSYSKYQYIVVLICINVITPQSCSWL
jgi:hypothetical protein